MKSTLAMVLSALVALLTACGAPGPTPALTIVPELQHRGANLTQVRASCDAPNDIIIEALRDVVVLNEIDEWEALHYSSRHMLDVKTEVGTFEKNSWYFVYATKAVTGAPIFEVSTIAPDATLTFKEGDAHFAFVTLFHTDVASPAVIRYMQTGRNYRFSLLFDAESGFGNIDNLLVAQGTATKQTTVKANDSLWRRASEAHLIARLTGGRAGGSMSIGPVNYAYPYLEFHTEPESTATSHTTIPMLESADFRFDYQISAEAKAADIWLAGFSF